VDENDRAALAALAVADRAGREPDFVLVAEERGEAQIVNVI
jgi:hypothetical protein